MKDNTRCPTCDRWHHHGPTDCADRANRRSHLALPMLINDSLEDIKGMHDGNVYTSKRALRQSYKDHGLVEVGDQAHTIKPREKARPKRDEVKASVHKAFSQAGLGS